jgi:hypothetical protein
MNTLHFFLGTGWLVAWYLAFYALVVIPCLLFLGFFRRSRRFGAGEGLMLTYSLGSTLLLLASVINAFLFAGTLKSHWLLTYPAALLGMIGLLALFRIFAVRCITRERYTRWHSWAMHGMVYSLVYLNLYSLWFVQA